MPDRVLSQDQVAVLADLVQRALERDGGGGYVRLNGRFVEATVARFDSMATFRDGERRVANGMALVKVERRVECHAVFERGDYFGPGTCFFAFDDEWRLVDSPDPDFWYDWAARSLWEHLNGQARPAD
jgi:hypothetical protein